MFSTYFYLPRPEACQADNPVAHFRPLYLSPLSGSLLGCLLRAPALQLALAALMKQFCFHGPPQACNHTCCFITTTFGVSCIYIYSHQFPSCAILLLVLSLIHSHMYFEAPQNNFLNGKQYPLQLTDICRSAARYVTTNLCRGHIDKSLRAIESYSCVSRECVQL